VSVRFRLYSVWGLSAGDILRLLMMLVVTFWLGALAAGGVSLLLSPQPLESLPPLLARSAKLAGALMVGVPLSYIGLSFVQRQPLQLGRLRLMLPGPRITVPQVLLAGCDLMAVS